MFWVWEHDEEREDARADRRSTDAWEAAEREAERLFEPADAFEDITLMVQQADGEPRKIVVDVEVRPEFRARKGRA